MPSIIWAAARSAQQLQHPVDRAMRPTGRCRCRSQPGWKFSHSVAIRDATSHDSQMAWVIDFSPRRSVCRCVTGILASPERVRAPGSPCLRSRAPAVGSRSHSFLSLGSVSAPVGGFGSTSASQRRQFAGPPSAIVEVLVGGQRLALEQAHRRPSLQQITLLLDDPALGAPRSTSVSMRLRLPASTSSRTAARCAWRADVPDRDRETTAFPSRLRG